jgi:hypothetical protein
MGLLRTGTAARFAGSYRRALALIAAVALVTLSLGVGVTSANNGRPHVVAENTFTKWVTTLPAMAGFVGGDVGDGSFAGEVLKVTWGPPTTVIEALYHFNGSQHSFTALVHVEQTGLKAVIIGVVTDGWMKGNPIEAEYTQGPCTHDGITTDCFQGSLNIMQALKP